MECYKFRRIQTSDEFRMMLKIYLWIMGWSGKINTWAWNKQVDIVRAKQRKDEEEYLKELKKKL